MKTVTVALIGYGNIGTGLCSNLHENHDIILERTGIDLRLKHVCDIDLQRERWFKVDPTICTRDYLKVVNDPEIDIVIELVGGTTDARDIIIRSFEKGKHVVTANKALIALKGRELFSAAEKSRRMMRFEASVGGGIPCIKALMEGLVSNRIECIAGIVNGTSNYILTRMTQDAMSFEDALALAKAKGFAEPNPTFDVEGIDPSHKITILSSLASGRMVDLQDVPVEGITGIEHIDIEIADKLNAVIKPLVIFRNGNDRIEARVHPMIVPRKHKLAFVNENFNILYMKGNFVGVTGFYGLGAGSVPTSSAVVADTIDIAKAIDTGAEYRHYSFPDTNSTAKVIPMDETTNTYCLRLGTDDAKSVVTELSKHSVIIKEQIEVSGMKVFVTAPVVEAVMSKAVKALSSASTVTSPPKLLRVFDLDI